MTRLEAERLAYRLATVLQASEERPDLRIGCLAVAAMIADDVAADGRITRDVFLRRCGITPQSFREQFAVDPTPARDEWEAEREAERIAKEAKGKKAAAAA